MPITLDELSGEAINLPPDSRAELAEKLVESLDFPVSDEIEAAWKQEAMRRYDEIRAGKAMPISGDEVIEEMRRLVGR